MEYFFPLNSGEIVSMISSSSLVISNIASHFTQVLSICPSIPLLDSIPRNTLFRVYRANMLSVWFSDIQGMYCPIACEGFAELFLIYDALLDEDEE